MINYPEVRKIEIELENAGTEIDGACSCSDEDITRVITTKITFYDQYNCRLYEDEIGFCCNCYKTHYTCPERNDWVEGDECMTYPEFVIKNHEEIIKYYKNNPCESDDKDESDQDEIPF